MNSIYSIGAYSKTRLIASEQRLHRELEEKWPEHEEFNLRKAFENQRKRVRSEWVDHINQVHQDFEQQRSILLQKLGEMREAHTKESAQKQSGNFFCFFCYIKILDKS